LDVPRQLLQTVGGDPSNHIATVQGATPPNSSSLDRGDCPSARKPCPPPPTCSSGHHTPSFHPAVHTDITGGYAGGTTTWVITMYSTLGQICIQNG